MLRARYWRSVLVAAVLVAEGANHSLSRKVLASHPFNRAER